MTHQSEIQDLRSQAIRVLLIEDNPGDVKLIQEMLGEVKNTDAISSLFRRYSGQIMEMLAEIKCCRAFEIEVAGQISSGLERLSRGGIDVVLLDLGLPDSQGLETLTRAREKADSIPIVVLTGLADERLGVRAVQEGAQDYLIKGQITSDLLIRAMRYAIERNRTEETLKKYSRRQKEKLNELEEKGFNRYGSLVKAKNSYIIKEKGYHKCAAIFSNLTKYGLKGLCLTMTHPDVLTQMYDLKDSCGKIIHISNTRGKGQVISPYDLAAIYGMTAKFVKTNENSVVIFLGFENIIILNGFENSSNFLNLMINLMIAFDSRLIITVHPENIFPKEYGSIEKSLIEIKDDDLILVGGIK